MATLGTRLTIWRKGVHAGTDQYGNSYYAERDGKRRWVIYAGEPDGSKVPPEWHAWLHRTVDEPPTGERKEIPWEKPHIPNLTGTSAAYRPSGSLIEGGRRPHATGDYEPWTPD